VCCIANTFAHGRAAKKADDEDEFAGIEIEEIM